MVSTFIMLTRGAVDMFNAGYGNYGDLWAAWIEGGICLTVTIIAASHWGLIGILIGKLASLLPIVVIWKPIYLYREGFHLPLKAYWKEVAFYYVAFGIAYVAIHWLARMIPLDPAVDYYHLIVYAVMVSSSFMLVYLVSLYLLTEGAKSLVRRALAFVPINRKR